VRKETVPTRKCGEPTTGITNYENPPEKPVHFEKQERKLHQEEKLGGGLIGQDTFDGAKEQVKLKGWDMGLLPTEKVKRGLRGQKGCKGGGKGVGKKA